MIRSNVRWTSAVAIAAAFVSCSDKPELTTQREDAVRAEGAAAAQSLLATLQTNLVTSMEEGGLVQAVEFCASRALALTDSVSESLGEGISIKRVSGMHRNPENAPDASELEAIRHFEAALAEDGGLPDDWVQETPAGELRYYRPLTILPPCLPAAGPMSTTMLAERIVASSCSTTITVLPMSRRCLSVLISRLLSRWCKPMVGSSST